MKSTQQPDQHLLHALYDILKNYPDGIKEYDLLVILREKSLPVFADGELFDTLALFKAHFMLFHLLYCLSDMLHAEQKGIIEIHCLNIIMKPWQSNDKNLPKVNDSLKEYYLNFSNMEEMDQVDVDVMIDTFWQDYAQFQLQPESYALLGLEVGASMNDIKKRYRNLAKQHHPDRGGDAVTFNSITHAAKVLLGE